MSLLIPSAVALLAHKRLVDAVDAMERKAQADVADVGSFAGDLLTVGVRDTDRRVLGLAKAALAMFEAGEKVDAPPHMAVGPGLGRFTLLGAAGFELPAYTNLFAPGGAWIADAVRRGTPDPNLSQVVAGSTQFAIRTGELALGSTTDTNERARIQAFSMGMLSAVAGGVVIGPVLRGLEGKRSRREWDRRMPPVDIAAAEARIENELLGGPGGAARWQGWWPPSGDAPDALFEGYAKALEEVYKLKSDRPLGFADFEHGFEPGDELTARRLRAAYGFLRQDAAAGAWSPFAWWGLLTPALLMPTLGIVIVHEMDHGRFWFSNDGPVDERSMYELLTVGLGLGAVEPFIVSMWLWSQIPDHTSAFVNALVLFIARAGLVTTALATLDADAGVRWGLLLVPLLGADVYAAIQAIRLRNADQPGQLVVFWLQTIPALTALTMLQFAAICKAFGVDSTLAFGLLLGLHSVLMLTAVGIPLAIALSKSGGFVKWFTRHNTGLPLLDSIASIAAPADPAAAALLFDDATLWHEAAKEPPALTDLRYPSGPRTLVKLWWPDAAHPLQITHDEHTVTFRKSDGSLLPVVLPPSPRTAADIATALKTALPGLEAVAPDPPYDLPFPHMLSDPGDTQPTLAAHEAHKGDFAPIGATEAAAYALRHTPRVELATPYGATGGTRSALESIPLVPGRSLGDLEDSALGLAADLAVLLAMGAAPSLAKPVNAAPSPGRPAVVPAGELRPVYQVFRQWNLDERRVNEWRMLVRGGAASEKAGAPAARDPAMRPDPLNAAYNSPAATGEPLATAMGWVPLWRAYLRVASDVTADSAAATAAAYTPPVALGDGTRVPPSNQRLTDAVRFLFELP